MRKYILNWIASVSMSMSVKKEINVFCTGIADKYKGMVLKPQRLVKGYINIVVTHKSSTNFIMKCH